MNFEVDKIYCGDNVEVLRTFPDACVDLVFTSPPYPGVDSMWGELFKSENFDKAHEYLDTVWNDCVRVLKPGCKLIINIADVGRNPYLDNSARLAFWGWNHKDLVTQKGKIIWNKGLAENGETAWGTWCNPADMSLSDNHEFVLVFRKNGDRISPHHNPIIDKSSFLEWRKSEWNIGTASAKKEKHVAPFPEELASRVIQMYSFMDEIVLDPFAGSGTTCKVSKELNRHYLGIDHSDEYCKLAQRRVDGANVPLFVE